MLLFKLFQEMSIYLLNFSNLNIYNSYSYIKILLHLLLSSALKINWKMTFWFVFFRKIIFVRNLSVLMVNYWKTTRMCQFFHFSKKSI